MSGNNGHMGIAPLNQGKAPTDCQERLAVLVSERGSLLAVSVATRINVGYLSAIRSGLRRASNRARIALGLKPHDVTVPACRKCGGAHPPKRCTRRPTFDERAAQYDAWLARNAARIAAIVAWAEPDGR